jgi:ribonuclease HI
VSGRHVLYADGASRGNPGLAAIGAVLYGHDGDVAATVSEAIGHTTNNVAEYRAVIAGLETALDLGVTEVDIRLDSLLLVKQVTGEYKVKAAGLRPLHRELIGLLRRLDAFSIGHVPREDNTVADRLANEALDR